MRRTGDRWGQRWGNGSDEERQSTWGRRTGDYGEFREDEPREESRDERERWREAGSTYRGGGDSDLERERWESGSGERFGRGSEQGGGGSFGGGSYSGRSHEGRRGASQYGSQGWRESSPFGRRRESFGGEGGWGRGSPGTWSGGRYTGGETGERWGRSGSEWAGGVAASGYGPTDYGSSESSDSRSRAHGSSSSGYGSSGFGSSTYGTGSQRQSRMRPRRMPKGYTRSDERIREDVCDRLSEADVECEEVTVTVRNGEVTLAGRAPSGDARREIERIAEDVAGVKDVTNQIRTRPGEESRDDSTESGDGNKSRKGQESSFSGSSSRQSSKTN